MVSNCRMHSEVLERLKFLSRGLYVFGIMISTVAITSYCLDSYPEGSGEVVSVDSICLYKEYLLTLHLPGCVAQCRPNYRRLHRFVFSSHLGRSNGHIEELWNSSSHMPLCLLARHLSPDFWQEDERKSWSSPI